MKNDKILIDREKLNLLLDSKKQYIGNKITIDSILSSVSFLVSVLFASYDDVFGISGKLLKYLFVCCGLWFTYRTIKEAIASKTNNYSFEDLLSDINKLNEIQHNHSIVVIKDTFNSFSNRFLVYDDLRWNCLLFPNYKDNDNNNDFITNRLSNEFQIKVDNISLEFVDQYISFKFSESNNEYRVYNHKFYIAKIKKFPKYMEDDNFSISNKKFCWKTIDELKQDDNVMKKNKDIVSHVEEII